MKNIEAARLDKFLQDIGKVLKTAREISKLTQKEIAERTGLREATISDIEAGKTNFKIGTFIGIGVAIGSMVEIRLVEDLSALTPAQVAKRMLEHPKPERKRWEDRHE